MRWMATVLLPVLLIACDDSSSAGDAAGHGDGTAADLRLSESGVPIPGDGAAPGTAKVGEPCTRDEDCAEPPNAKCFTTVGGGFAPTVTFPGGYCSRGCGNEDSGSPDCGEGGGCAQMGLSGGMGSSQMSFCAKICKKNEECRVAEGYTCRFFFPGLPGFCAPP